MRGEPDEGRTARGRFAVLGGEGVAKRFFGLNSKRITLIARELRNCARLPEAIHTP